MGQSLGRGGVVENGPDQPVTPAGNPLPSILHTEISARQLGTGRLIMVGDVHGCCDELRCLLRQCVFKQGTDTLIFNGDMINKGPKSSEVIDYIRSLGALAVRGNQDDKALAEWIQWKSGSSLKAHSWLEQLGEDRAQWLGQLPFSISIPSYQVAVVHAGMVPGVPLEKQSLETLTEIRTMPDPNSTASGEMQPSSTGEGTGGSKDAGQAELPASTLAAAMAGSSQPQSCPASRI
ncbi:hypothetical protein WJX84_004032 [Apatococcus fuscideae]|uniref:Calcineurin-like phosphoesterase domain-containing protein n=1 Tax=Apatococcus fuscideae TaxID=2026836 RepID=A0AAW1SU28_9CHLO